MKAAGPLALAACLGVAPPAGAADGAWYPVDSPTTARLSNVRFGPRGPHGRGEGWAVGEHSTVLRYDGSRWAAVPGPGGDVALRWVAPAGPGEIWAAGEDGGYLYHYERGQWTRHFLHRDFECHGLDFRGPGLGYAVGLFGQMYRYDGARWAQVAAKPLAEDREGHLRGVALLAPDDVWVGTSAGFVAHFDGASWQRSQLEGGGSVLRVGDEVVAVGRGLWRRHEGAWSRASAASPWRVAAHRGRLWGVTEGRALVEVGAEGLREVPTSKGLDDLAATDEGAWAVGEDGIILTFEDERLPTFLDRTFEAGVGVLASSRAALRADLDGAEGADLVLFAPFGRHSFLRSEGAGSFRSRPLEHPPEAALGDHGALAVADLDGDGRADLVLRPPGRPGAAPWRLLRNLGRWRFREAPAPPPLEAPDASPAGDLEVADLDGDGDLDVLEARLLEEPTGRPLADVLWRNDGVGRLRAEPFAASGARPALAWTRALLPADVDDDGRLDVVEVNEWTPGNRLYRQRPDGLFEDVTREAGLGGTYQENARAVAGDVDGDGDDDLFFLAYGRYGPSRLYRNEGGGRFRDATTEAGLAWLTAARAGEAGPCAELADLENDGDLDLVLCAAPPPAPAGAAPPPRSALRLWLNDGRGHFTEATTKAGANLPAESAVVDDLDGDGDVDIYAVYPGTANRLLTNEAPAGRWLRVELEGLPPNRAGLGARVRAYGPGGALLATRRTSWRHPVAHVGLGRAAHVALEVRFPSGRIVRREGVAAGGRVVVPEGRPLERVARGAAFLLRHRLAWMDHGREALKLAAVLAALAALGLGLPSAGPRARRGLFAGGALAAYAALALACAPWAPVLALADAAPPALVLGAGAAWVARRRARAARRGSQFVGPYALGEAIGWGGMGIVYRARDATRPSAPSVALKVLRPDRTGDPASLRRFRREAEIGARLRHPGIVRVLASGECRVLEGGAWRRTVYIAMELVEGRSLGALLASGERPTLPRALAIVRDAAAALGAAHAAGGLHRDVKPDNLLLTRTGAVKLVDFGIGLLDRATATTEAGLLVGTLAYLPPERVAGQPECAQSDLYALGVVLYELVCGRRPFVEDSPAALLSALSTRPPPPPRALNPHLPPELEALLLALLDKVPSRRPPSAEALAAALERVLRTLRGFAPAPLAGAAPGAVARLPAPPAPRPRSDGPAPFERVTLDLPAPPPGAPPPGPPDAPPPGPPDAPPPGPPDAPNGPRDGATSPRAPLRRRRGRGAVRRRSGRRARRGRA